MDQNQQQPKQQAEMSNQDIPEPVLPKQPKSTNIIRVTLLDPFTPIQPSTMHVHDLTDDCVRILLETQFETLQDLVLMAFVCTRWFTLVQTILRTRQDSLKLFDTEQNIENYQNSVQMEYNLVKLDQNAAIKRTGDKQEDHILVPLIPQENIETLNIENVLIELFGEMKSLVLNSKVIDNVKLIQSLNELTSITLLELPNEPEKQNQIWEALNQAPKLAHVHLLRTNVLAPFDAEKMNFLTRIESFTLDNYWHSNVSAITDRLNSEKVRYLHV